MKKINFIFLLLLFLSSCIQEEPKNPEADILSFLVPEWNINYGENYFSGLTGNDLDISVFAAQTSITNTKIVPQITITPGATITPSPTVEQDFKEPITYTVTSENGKTIRRYTFSVIYRLQAEYDFEHWETNQTANKGYETPVEYIDGTKQTIWDSGNPGVAIYMNGNAADFPTHSTTVMTAEGQYAAELITKQGPGNILGIQYIPIVSGSLFIGKLIPLNALNNPLTATQFGTTYTFSEMPERLTGYYYYRPGTGDYIYVNPNDKFSSLSDPNKKDMCSLYAILYETDNDYKFTLDGTNITSDPSIVSMAVLPDELRKGSPGTGLYAFDIPFELKVDPSTVDLENKHYKIAIVFAASYDGDKYAGTPGSRLVVDNVKLIIQPNLKK